MTNISRTIWLTGLSGAGKTTLALALAKRLTDLNISHYALDGDIIRTGLNKDLGFLASDRKENIRRIGEVCCLFCDAGLTVIASFISPFLEDRDNVKKAHKEKGFEFFEVFVDAPLEVCEKRDIKGLYNKARSGLIKDFTGIDSPYEIPKNADIVVKTDVDSVDQCCDKIIAKIIG